MGSGLWRWTEMPERSPASPKSFDCQMALETFTSSDGRKDAGSPEQQQLETFRTSPSGSLAKEQIDAPVRSSRVCFSYPNLSSST
jgi:hypothetical protein